MTGPAGLAACSPTCSVSASTSTCPLPFASCAQLHASSPPKPAALRARAGPAACARRAAPTAPRGALAHRRLADEQTHRVAAFVGVRQAHPGRPAAARAHDATAHRPDRAPRRQIRRRARSDRARGSPDAPRARSSRRPRRARRVSVGRRAPTARDRDRRRPPRPTPDRIDRTHRPARRRRPRAVAAASVATSTLVRPDDRAPTSSDTSPRRHPPPSSAIERGDPRRHRPDARRPAGVRASVPSSFRPGAAIRADEWPRISCFALCSPYGRSSIRSVREGDQEAKVSGRVARGQTEL